LIERICRASSKLERFGLPNFPPAGQAELQTDLRRMQREICFTAGKPKRQSQTKKLYHQLLRRGERATKRFTRELAAATHALNATTQLPPSERALATALLAQIGEDIRAIGHVAATCRRRVLAE
jgi:plasmid stabilization system protein ParE